MVKLGPASSKLLIEPTSATDPQTVGPGDSVNTADSDLTHIVNSTEVADAQPLCHVDSVYTADHNHLHTIDSTPVADLHVPRAVNSDTLADTVQVSPIDSSPLANCDATLPIDSSSLADGGKGFSLREVPHLWDNNPYDPLPFPEEFDTVPFTRRNPPRISLIGAATFKKLIDIGEDVFSLHCRPFTDPIANLRAVGNDPAPTTALHAEPLPTDENELITKVVPPEYHDFFDVFSREEVKLMPPHRPYDHTIDLENDQMPPHSHIYPLSVSRIITASILHFKEHTTYCLRLSTATGA